MKGKGFTLVELLVALLTLGILFLAASEVTTRFLQTRAQLDTKAGLQGKLRRIVEVFTQDLRSAAFGGIGSIPYPSGAQGISFVLIEGGAGYPVRPHDSGNNESFKQAAEAKIVALVANRDQLGIQDGDQVLLVNGAGQATVLSVTRVNPVGQNLWHVVHPGCGNTIDYTPNTLLFRARTLGFRFDPQAGTLFARYGTGGEVPVAFNLTNFQIDYVYEGSGTLKINPPVYAWKNPQGSPPVQTGGLVLRRLVLSLEAEGQGRGRPQRISYSSAVELPRTGSYDIQELLPCQ